MHFLWVRTLLTVDVFLSNIFEFYLCTLSNYGTSLLLLSTISLVTAVFNFTDNLLYIISNCTKNMQGCNFYTEHCSIIDINRLKYIAFRLNSRQVVFWGCILIYLKGCFDHYEILVASKMLNCRPLSIVEQ